MQQRAKSNDLDYMPSNQKPLRCDACGQFIPWDDLFEGYAVRRLVSPDSHFNCEEYETFCAKHK